MLIISLFLAFLPAVFWLIFYLSEDSHVEPRSLVTLTFLSGIAFAFFALVLQTTLNKSGLTGSPVALGKSSDTFTKFILSLIIFAAIEEFCKFIAAYVVVRKSPDFNRPIDAMVFVVIAALGFATLENIGVVAPVGGQILAVGSILETLAMRFIGATLLHTLSSGLFGYYWAVSIRRFGSKIWLCLGFVLATLLHAGFNYLIIRNANIFYSLAFVMLLGFFTLSDFEKLKQEIV